MILKQIPGISSKFISIMTVSQVKKVDMLLRVSLILLIALVVRLVFLDGYKILDYYFDLSSDDGMYHSLPIGGRIKVLYYWGFALFEIMVLMVAVLSLFRWTKINSLILLALLIPFFLQFAIPQLVWFVEYRMVNWYTIASIVLIALLLWFVLKKNKNEHVNYIRMDFIALITCALFFCCYFYFIVYVL
jgi:hypothetical protein